MRTRRTIFAVIFLALAAGFCFGAEAQTAPSLAKPWTEGECATVGGQWAGNDCYVKQVPVNIGVSIGGLNKATLSQYLAAAFNLGVGIAAVLATIFIMIGGFRYIYAAGGSGVEAAKGMIKNAVIGLVLTALSYTLLQTVNPAILSLQVPPIKLLKSVYLNQLAASTVDIGGPCYTIQDKDACAQACVKKGLTDTTCVCKVIDGGFWTLYAKVTVLAATAVVGGEVGAIKTAGNALQGVERVGMNLATRLWTYAKANPFAFARDTAAAGTIATTAGFLGAAGYAILPASPEKGEEGVCLPLALQSIEPGGTCFLDENNCVKGSTCVPINKDLGMGMCASGAENTACNADEPAFQTGSKTSSCLFGMDCCVVSYGLGTCQKSCTSGKPLDSLCTDNSECQSGYCSLNIEKATKVCEKGTTGSYCGDASGCTPDRVCKTPFYIKGDSYPLDLYRQNFDTCQTKGRTGDPCCDKSECILDSCNRTATGPCQITILSGQISYGSAGACN